MGDLRRGARCARTRTRTISAVRTALRISRDEIQSPQGSGSVGLYSRLVGRTNFWRDINAKAEQTYPRTVVAVQFRAVASKAHTTRQSKHPMKCCPCHASSFATGLSVPLLQKSCPEQARRRWLSMPPGVTSRANLFIFHGTHEHSGRYAEFAALCNYYGVRVISFDYRGHGVRDKSVRGDFGSMEDAIAEAIDLVTSELATSLSDLPLFIFGHSLGSMVAAIVAHELAERDSLPTPDGVILSGFAMDGVIPPFGIQALTPMITATPELSRKFMGCFSTLSPHGPAGPLPPPSGLTRDAVEATKMLRDPLHYHGWVQNRTAFAMLNMIKRCEELLAEDWGHAFPFLLVHGGDDQLCPVSACHRLMAASPQADKELRVFSGCLHEILFAPRSERANVHSHILGWISGHLDSVPA